MSDDGPGSGGNMVGPTIGRSGLLVDTVQPHCVQCQASRSVFQHRRKREGTEQRRMCREVVAGLFYMCRCEVKW